MIILFKDYFIIIFYNNYKIYNIIIILLYLIPL